VTFARSCHLLACQFEILADCEQVMQELSRLLNCARQEYPPSRHYRYRVTRCDERYSIREDGGAMEVLPDVGQTATRLAQRMHDLALAALPDYTRVHAGCADWQGKRALVIGAQGSGKTTLMMRLLCEGFTVHADEMVLVRAGEAVPFPRRFRIKASTWELVPQLGTQGCRPATGEREPIGLFDPSEIGLEWCITPGRVDAMFFIDPNHGGATSISRCPKYLMARQVMAQSRPPGAGGREWIHHMCATVANADCFSLTLGDLDTAVSSVQATLAGVMNDNV
jgi:hypothetical protein